MRPDLFTDLYEKEQSYWWHVCKRELVLCFLEKFELTNGSAGRGIGLDIGCGAGYTAKILEAECRMVAIDLSPESLKKCQQRGLRRLCRADVGQFSLPFKTASFDFVLALDVIEHVEDPIYALAECRRILKDRGFLIVTVPAFMALWSPWDEALGHKRRYTGPTLRSDAEASGLAVIKMSYFFFLVFPIAVVVRKLKQLIRGEAQSYPTDFIPLPAFVNRILIQSGRLERWIIGNLNGSLPFGLSVIAAMENPSPRGCR